MRVRERLHWHYREFIKHHFPFFWSKHLSQEILGKKTDFSNLKDLNEKIQWLMFFTDTTLWTLLADKYAVRKYVSDRIGEDYLIPLLGVWKDARDINFDSLPDKFVIKPNNGSYDVVVCKNKNKADIELIRRKMDYSLTHKFGYENAEPHYLSIPPCVLAEELLESNVPGGLIDYKIWCFNGTPHCIFVCANRDIKKHSVDFAYYDLEWRQHPEFMTKQFQSTFSCPRPKNLDEMLRVASKLSHGLPQARIDLYNINGKIYFGEITLSSNFGMMPYFTAEVLKEMGDLVQLPKRTAKEKISTYFKRILPII